LKIVGAGLLSKTDALSEAQQTAPEHGSDTYPKTHYVILDKHN